MFHTTGLFCRNLGLLLGSGLTLSATLRILVDLLDRRGRPEAWTRVADHVRHGGKLSDALADAKALPATAVRMLRIGEGDGTACDLEQPHRRVLRGEATAQLGPNNRDRRPSCYYRDQHHCGWPDRLRHDLVALGKSDCGIVKVSDMVTFRALISRRLRRPDGRFDRNGEAGFTLVEMLVVITIIAMIMALVAPARAELSVRIQGQGRENPD